MASSPAVSELQIVAAFRNRARYECPRIRMFAVPNAGKRTPWQARQAKAEGMSAGVPDIVALHGGKVAFLEFKTVRGRVSDNQSEWLDWLSAEGFPCGIFRDADSALSFLRAQGFPFMSQVAA